MTRTVAVGAGIFALCVALVAEAADDAFLELTVHYDRSAGPTLLKQRIVPGAAPKRRHASSRPHQLVLQCNNALGVTLGETSVDDPTVVYADWPADADQHGRELTGQQATLPSGVFLVRLPLNDEVAQHLDHVKLLRPEVGPDGTVKRLTPAGSCPVDRQQLRTYLTQRSAAPTGRPESQQQP